MKPASAKILLHKKPKGIAKLMSCSEWTLNLLQSQHCPFDEGHVITPLPPWEHFHTWCENSMLMYSLFNQWNYAKLTYRIIFRKRWKMHQLRLWILISEKIKNCIYKNYFIYCKLKIPLRYFSNFCEYSYYIYCLFYNLQNQLHKEKKKAPSLPN